MSQQLTFWDIPSVTFLPESADGASRSGLPDGPTTARSGPEAAPASVSAPLESNADLPTSATCGPCSPISSASAALNASLANRLKTRFATVGSIEYTQTWKEKVTPSGRMYWAHTASERRIGDTASIGEPYPWPTTQANNTNDAEKRGELANDPRNGLPMVAQICAWPTATSRDWKDCAEVPNVPLNALLGRMVWQVFLPGQTGAESTAATGKLDGYRLNPYFSGWLMGFPKAWTEAGLRASRKTAASRSPRKKKGAQCS